MAPSLCASGTSAIVMDGSDYNHSRGAAESQGYRESRGIQDDLQRPRAGKGFGGCSLQEVSCSLACRSGIPPPRILRSARRGSFCPKSSVQPAQLTFVRDRQNPRLREGALNHLLTFTRPKAKMHLSLKSLSIRDP
jgi:hypothetical protein